ncbi:MAG: rod shape-determining protein MreC [Paludibacteraceae bacterium]|nr:rod shape-determining protein MreC [Paludibacteraceae bacterium]MBQ4018521.1 rod shape-determining protein MreC [Paludibacteraceae bacterium]
MQNLLKILLRYSNFLVFIVLEVAAFLLIGFNNPYPHSSLLSTANDAVAWQHETVSEINGYFSLRHQNELLAQENAALRNELSAIDSTEHGAALHYTSAKVVQMTTDELHNYLTINRGSKDGIRRGQGVRNGDGVVGIVRTVGRNYSVVLPIINTRTNLSCRFAKNDYIGTLQWDGKDSRFAMLTDVAAHMVVNQGDTIITSGLSPVFPEGIPVGIVENSVLKEGDSYHTIRVRLYTNFKRLKYVEVIQNADQNELEDLMHGLD